MNTDFIDHGLDEAWECPTCLRPMPAKIDYECGTCETMASHHLSVTTLCKLLRETQRRESCLIVESKEQARLLGMSAERECDLRGKIERLERERDALQEQLNAALMLGKMQERRHERELEQVRLTSAAERMLGQCRQSLTINK